MKEEDRGRGAVEEKLTGTVSRVVYRNRDNDFTVIQLDVPDRNEPVSVVGRMPELETGASVSASGEWSEHPRFGVQFAAEAVLPAPPKTLDGLTAYLGSKAISGIGKIHAGRLAERFGEELFDILENSPHRLREVNGIGPERVRRITESWGRNKATRDAMVHLHGLGLGPATAATILRIYGNQAVSAVANNPFQLIRDVRGVGFKKADALAERSGIPKESPDRIMAGIEHLMNEARSSGNCGLPSVELLEQAERLLGIGGDLVVHRGRDAGQRRRAGAVRS